MLFKRASKQEESRIHDFLTTTLCILDDVPRAPDADQQDPRSRAYRTHEEHCDAMHHTFTTCFPGADVKSVRFQPGQNERHFFDYFRTELGRRGPRDLMVMYLYCPSRESVGDGDEYTWYAETTLELEMTY